MKLSLKNIFDKFVLLVYGDSSTLSNGLEDIIYGDNALIESELPVLLDEKSLYKPSENEVLENVDNTEDQDFGPEHDEKNSKEIACGENQPANELPISRELSDVPVTFDCSLCSNVLPIKSYEDLANILTELDMVKNRLDSVDSRNVIQFCQERIIECMIKWGVDVIDDCMLFNPMLHIPEPYSIVKEGTPISEYLRVGLKYNNKVLLKALVKI